jgi:hypothetical protein
MKKEYKVIPVEDYGVVVDEKGTTPNGSWVYNNRLNDVFQIGGSNQPSATDALIIATIGRRLEGIPLIEEVDEDLLSIALKESENIDGTYQSGLVDGFSLGQAAQSKGVYTEDDIHKAMLFAISTREKAVKGGALTLPSNEDEEKQFKEDFTTRFNKGKSLLKEFIASLQKKKLPTSVELEMEEEIVKCPHCEGYGVTIDGKCNMCKDGKLHIDDKIKIHNRETNTITPIKFTK